MENSNPLMFGFSACSPQKEQPLHLNDEAFYLTALTDNFTILTPNSEIFMTQL